MKQTMYTVLIKSYQAKAFILFHWLPSNVYSRNDVSVVCPCSHSNGSESFNSRQQEEEGGRIKLSKVIQLFICLQLSRKEWGRSSISYALTFSNNVPLILLLG
uniref:Uncharacterized protein n=1 Tax=Cacopsylla melanoneura TaxID=428564 RepID=A0A8D9EZ12_9HEMI